MRGGTYGWKAAKAGFLFMGWTNTLANMPAWGAVNSKLGNNPLVMAVPFNDEAIVLDMAMSQFSYGALEKYALNKKDLPVAGGFDKVGKITYKPEDIIETKRIMPAGYWKGAGLSLLLDIFSTILTGGLSTSELSKKEVEYGLSQVFIAIDIKKLSNFPSINDTVNAIIQDYKTSIPAGETDKIVYPGENIVRTRNKNLAEGIPVDKSVWSIIERL
jgi:3-dehydro-L-gulonate 2-dehydrogenase